MLIRWQPHNWAEARTFLSATPSETPNSGGSNDAQRRSSADVLTQYGNDAVRMADRVATLEGENYRYREQRRELQDEVKALKANQRPEGATILTGDDATAYDAYTALGKPAEIKGKLDQTDALSAELGDLKRAATIRQVAEVVGFKPAVLTRLGGDREYVVKDETEDGKPVKRAYVKTEQGDKPLADYAAAEWADFLPALTATNVAQQGQQAGGVRYPAQGGGGAQPPANAADAFFEQKYPSRG